MAQNNTTNTINLDKTCAEFGMNLLEEFSLLNTDMLSNEVDFDGLEGIVDNFKFTHNESNLDINKRDDYKIQLENKINEIIKNISQNNKLKLVKKYLIITWGLYPFEKKLIDDFNFSKLKEVEKEKNRIQKLTNNFQIKFEFSASNFETEITKALGILVEDGPFAYMVWLKSQDKEPHRAMLIQTARILKELKLIADIATSENLKEKLENVFLGNIASDLTKTLFVKTILEKMLTYARYKAKAMQHE